MVIKDENGNPVVLITKRDILDYIFDKCGLEVGMEVKNIFKNEEQKISPEDCEGCQDLISAKNRIKKLEYMISDLEMALQTLKERSVKFLKDRHFHAAAKVLQTIDEIEEE